jgi:hypothetical protein
MKFVQGIPDKSQIWMDRFAEGFENAFNKRIEPINKALPKGIQIPKLDMGKGMWPAFRTILYTSGLGLRPAVAIRDMWQSMFGLVTIGPRAFAEGMARAMSKEGRAEAEVAGALLHGRNVGQFFGDITGDLPSGGRMGDYINRYADILMAPSRMGHNFGRTITFLGEKQQALRAIEDYRAGRITDPLEVAGRTAAWFHDKPERDRLLAMAADPTVSADKAAETFALSAVEATQFGGAPGLALRTGIGRILGQYASWPMNHLEFTRKLLTRAMPWNDPRHGIPALAMWTGLNYAAFEAAESVGIDAKKWLFVSPAGWTGSPTLEMVENLLKAPEESDAGRKARHDILTFPLQMVPTGVELKNLYKAYDTGDWNMPAILGFRNLKEPQQQRDLGEQLYYEFGSKPPQ